jgi:hypothetical protein
MKATSSVQTCQGTAQSRMLALRANNLRLVLVACGLRPQLKMGTVIG